MDQLVIYEPSISELPIAAPCVRIALYLPPEERPNPAPMAAAVESYFALIPENALTARIVVDIDEETDDEARVSFERFGRNDAAALVDEYHTIFTTDAERHSVSLVSGFDYGTTGFALHSLLADPPDPVFKGWRNYIWFDIELEFARKHVNRVVAFARKLIGEFPDCTMTGTVAVSHSIGVTPIIRTELNAKLMRFVALDPDYDAINFNIDYDIPFPAWLTYLNMKQIERIGGREVLEHDLPSKYVLNTSAGALLRASYLPPLGDVNRGAKDVGLLPLFDTVLCPALLKDANKLRNFGADEAELWFKRYADINPQPWDNETLVAY